MTRPSELIHSAAIPMARRKPDTRAATETLEEIEGVFDRAANWVMANPSTFLGTLGAILALTGTIGLTQWWTARSERQASEAVALVQSEYLNAMGAAPGTFTFSEPANPETAREVRLAYVTRFLEAAEDHSGKVAAVEARLEAGSLQREAGDLDAALETWQRAADDAPAGSILRGLALTRLAGGLEAAERWPDAAAAHEQAGDIEGFPIRYYALTDAARCYAEADDLPKARSLLDRVAAEAPDLQIPPHVKMRVAAE